jgi:hypothetical protein
MYEERTYREIVTTNDLARFQVVVKETDLLVRAERALTKETRDSVLKYRRQLETYIEQNPGFQESLLPLKEDPYAPEIVREMIRTSGLARVGPMAAVAGAIAEWVSRDLLRHSRDVIVENGGDIYVATSKERTIAIYAGNSPLSLRVGIIVRPEDSPLGICTSSGTVGHSLSLGKADAVCILSRSAALADAAATAVGNRVREKSDIEAALERGREIQGVLGVVIVVGPKMGVWGNIRLTPLEKLTV